MATLLPGESATVLVEVRKIHSRSVRRRGMRPLVEATVADATGPMKVAFFNQPWLERKYPPGTRLVLHGKYRGRNSFSVQAHAPTSEAVAGARGVAHYPAARGSPRRRSWRWCASTACARRRARAAPRPPTR